MSPPDDDGGEADPRRPDRTGDRRHGGAGKAVGGERRRTPDERTGDGDKVHPRRRWMRPFPSCPGRGRAAARRPSRAPPAAVPPHDDDDPQRDRPHRAPAWGEGARERRGRKRALFSDGPPRLRLGRDAGFPPPVRPGRRADGMRLCHRPCQRAARSRSERDWAEPDERHAGLDCEHQQRRARLYFLRGRAIAFPPEYHQRGQRPQEQGGTGGGTNREGCHRRNGPMSDILEIYPAAEAR